MKRSLFVRFFRMHLFYITGLVIVLLAVVAAMIAYIKTGDFYIFRVSNSEEGERVSVILFAVTYVYFVAMGQMLFDHSNAYAFLRKHVFTRSGEFRWNFYYILVPFVTGLPALAVAFALNCFSGMQLLATMLYSTGICSLTNLIMYIKGHPLLKVFLVFVCLCFYVVLGSSFAGRAIGCYILLAVGMALTAVAFAAVGYIVGNTRLDAKGVMEQMEEQAI